MLAYSAEELLIEPYAGLVFGLSAGITTKLAGLQHGGALAGMILVALSASAVGGAARRSQAMDRRRLPRLGGGAGGPRGERPRGGRPRGVCARRCLLWASATAFTPRRRSAR